MMIKALVLFTLTISTATYAAVRPQPRGEQMIPFVGWYSTGADAATAERIVIIDVNGIGRVEYATPGGRPWIVVDSWVSITLGTGLRVPFRESLNTRLGLIQLSRMPGTQRGTLVIDGLTLTRQPPAFRDRLDFAQHREENVRATYHAQVEVLRMIVDLKNPARLNEITVEKMQRARQLVLEANARYQAHWKLEKEFGFSDVKTFYRQRSAHVPRESWEDLKQFEASNRPWIREERIHQLQLMRELAAIAANRRASPAVREAAAVEIPGLSYAAAAQQLVNDLCVRHFGAEAPPSAPGDLVHQGHVQVEGLPR